MVGKEEFAASVEIPLITGALVLHWSNHLYHCFFFVRTVSYLLRNLCFFL